MSNTKVSQKGQVSWAQAFRDIVITAMNKGQLLLISCIAFVFYMVSKMSENATDTLINKIIDNLGNTCFISYVLLCILILVCYYNSKKLRNMHNNECERIGKEKTKLQEKLEKALIKGGK